MVQAIFRKAILIIKCKKVKLQDSKGIKVTMNIYLKIPAVKNFEVKVHVTKCIKIIVIKGLERSKGTN